jgi:hypothetical protein
VLSGPPQGDKLGYAILHHSHYKHRKLCLGEGEKVGKTLLLATRGDEFKRRQVDAIMGEQRIGCRGPKFLQNGSGRNGNVDWSSWGQVHRWKRFIAGQSFRRYPVWVS